MKKHFAWPIVLAAMLLFAVLAATQTVNAYEWQNVTVGGGGYVPGIVYSKAEPGLVYARTDVGGVYRWNPAESSWIPLTDSFSDMNNLGVTSLALDPNDADRVYIATGLYTQSWWNKNGAIYRSLDRGRTWEKTELPFKLGGNDPGRGDGEKLQVDPNNSRHLYLATIANGLWRSTDYGLTWNKVTSFPGTKCTFVAFDEKSGTVNGMSRDIYVGTFDNLPNRLQGGVYKSSDGGASWSLIPGQPTQLAPKSYDPANVPLPPNALQAVIGGDYVFFAFSNGPSPHGDYVINNNILNGAVYRYNKVTGEWNDITPNVELQGGYCGLDIHPDDPDTVFVASISRWWPQDDIHYTTDAGKTWGSLILNTEMWPYEPIATFDTTSAPYSAEKVPHWMSALAINPFNPNEAMFGTGYGIFRTVNLGAALSDGKTHWVFDNNGLEETVPLELISPPVGAALVSALGDIDGFRHDDLDVSPLAGAHAPNGGTSVSIAFAQNTPNAMVRSHNSGTAYGSMSWDGGDNWYFFSSQPAGARGGGPIAISADATSIVWAPEGAAVSYSHNGGSSWASSQGIPAGLKPVADRSVDNTFHAYDKINGRAYRSTNGGASFVATASGLPALGTWDDGGVLISVFDHPGHLWLALGYNGLYRSVDNAQSFQKINGADQAYIVTVGKAAPGATYPAIFIHGIIDASEGLYRSDNIGSGWIKINNADQEWGRYYTCMTGDPNRFGRVYVGTQGRGTFYGDPTGPLGGGGSDPIIIPVSGVGVTPGTIALGVNESAPVTVNVLPANATNTAVHWVSADPAVATVSASGMVTARTPGPALITVTTLDGGFTAACRVTVTPGVVSVTGVSILPTSVSIEVGATVELVAAVAPADASNSAVSWSSGPPSVAAVDGGGRVTGRSPGAATITVTTADGGLSASSVVTVVQPSSDGDGDDPPPGDSPTARMDLSTTVGAVPLAVTFNAADSTSPSGDTLTYQWAFGDGATASGIQATHTYAQAGNYTVTLTVSDGIHQHQTSATVTARVGGQSGDERFNYAEALQKSLYFYDANKSGPGITGGRLSWRGDCMLVDMVVPLNTQMTNLSQSFINTYRNILDPDGTGTVDLSGGYHDAGDHVKFGLPQSYSSSTLEWALYEFKDAFVETGSYDHLLDVLRWSSDYYLRSTFKNSDGKVVAFAYQVGEGSIDHNWWGPPELVDHEALPRPAYFATAETPASDQAAGAAASLAISFLNLRQQDPQYAARCLDAAVALYAFATNHRGLGYDGGFYNSSYDYDELAWAAVWLHIATGENRYLQDIISEDAQGRKTGWLSRIINSAQDQWQNIWVHCWDTKWGGVFAKLAPITNDPLHWEIFRWNLEYWSGVPRQNTHDTNYLMQTPAGFSYLNTWGSARYNAAAQFQAMVYKKYTGSTIFDSWMTRQIQYIMGDNPLNRSYIVGYSDNYAKHPHHRAAHGSSTNSVFDPPEHKHILWGALVGGPGLHDEHVDDTNDYIYNEVAIDYNAGLVGALAGHYTYFGQGHQPLADFPPTDPELVEFKIEGKIEQVNAERSQLTIRVTNESAYPPRRDIQVAARYFFNISELFPRGQSISDVRFEVYYDQHAVQGASVEAVGPIAWDAASGIYYMEFRWPDEGFYGTREYQFALIVGQDATYTAHWDPSNDYSFQGLGSTYVETPYIPLYVGGEHYLGLLPGDSVPTPDPVDPDPVTPDPVTPDPVDPDPVTPDPVDPDPVDPDPGTSPTAACTVNYTIANQWNTGFTAEVQIVNNTGTPISGYTLAWDFGAGQSVSGGWNAIFTQSGTKVNATNPAGNWNGTIGNNGGAVTFGFQGTYNGNQNPVPAVFRLNGRVCGEPGAVDPVEPDPIIPDPVVPDPVVPDPVVPDPVNPDPVPAAACTVNYAIANEWNTGFTADVQIVNNSAAPVSGYILTWDYGSGQQVTSSWNASITQSGATVSAANPAGNWNGTIGANGGAVSFGFQGTHTNTNPAPTVFRLNGQVCGGPGVVPDPNPPDPDQPDPELPDPTVSCPPVPSGNEYQDRFMALWCDIHDPANGYFSPEGVPYHSVETLIVEAPDYGHQSTSEGYSYWLWLEAMYGAYTGNWQFLETAWNNMEAHIIPTQADQPTNSFYNPNAPAAYAAEYPQPSDYPSPLNTGVPVGRDPLGQELAGTYGNWNIYGMHWLLDADNIYGYGRRGDRVSRPSYINTFQRGEQESVWETVPHPSWESFIWGGNNGFLDLFIGDDNYARQWRYTNAPDADARVVQVIFWAKRAADAQGGSPIVDDLTAKAAKMGDYLRYSLFDKYFKEIGCQSAHCPGVSGRDSAHYLLSWYYAWGGAVDPHAGWAFRIGSSHTHFGYQNPVAAWVLSSQSDFVPKSPTAREDWQNSLQRQLEFYRWLQSPQGAIAGGATNSVNGDYSAHPAGVSTFYGMAYDEHPVYHDPGSNSWFGWQAWSMERVAEYYYLTGDSLAEQIMDDWIPFAMNNVQLTGGTFFIPGELQWRGQPDTWTGVAGFTGNPNLGVTVVNTSQDLGITAGLAKTLAYYSAGKREHRGVEHAAARAMAFDLMDRMWANYRDDKGVSVTETRGDYARMDDPVYISDGWNGIMGNGAPIDSDSTFLSLRTFYLDDPMYADVRAALDAGQDPSFNYHRFWAQAEVALANAELDRLFP